MRVHWVLAVPVCRLGLLLVDKDALQKKKREPAEAQDGATRPGRGPGGNSAAESRDSGALATEGWRWDARP